MRVAPMHAPIRSFAYCSARYIHPWPGRAACAPLPATDHRKARIAPLPLPLDSRMRPCMPAPRTTQMLSDCAAAIVDCAGQYGHLNLAEREPRASFVTEPSASTWPHGSIIGGLSGVASSLEMGQVNVEWNVKFGPRSRSMGSVAPLLHSSAYLVLSTLCAHACGAYGHVISP